MPTSFLSFNVRCETILTHLSQHKPSLSWLPESCLTTVFFLEGQIHNRIRKSGLDISLMVGVRLNNPEKCCVWNFLFMTDTRTSLPISPWPRIFTGCIRQKRTLLKYLHKIHHSYVYQCYSMGRVRSCWPSLTCASTLFYGESKVLMTIVHMCINIILWGQ